MILIPFLHSNFFLLTLRYRYAGVKYTNKQNTTYTLYDNASSICLLDAYFTNVFCNVYCIFLTQLYTHTQM